MAALVYLLLFCFYKTPYYSSGKNTHLYPLLQRRTGLKGGYFSFCSGTFVPLEGGDRGCFL